MGLAEMLQEIQDETDNNTPLDEEEEGVSLEKPKNIKDVASWLLSSGNLASEKVDKACDDVTSKVLSDPEGYKRKDWQAFKTVVAGLLKEGREKRALNLLKQAKCSNAEKLLNAIKAKL